jgi:two-component sensor histidine kinase
MTPNRILLVDDDSFICISLGRNLEHLGYHVTTADSGNIALEMLERERFDIVVSDLVMRRPDGLVVLRRCKELRPETAVIILTGFGDLDSAVAAIRLGADDYVNKPCDAEELSAHIARCTTKQQTLLALMREVTEKNALLRETHHRVKNDFLMISGLINLQLGWVSDEPDRTLFRELQSRIQVLTLVHERLQQSESFDSVELKPLVTELCRRAVESFGHRTMAISLDIDVEAVTLVPDMAIPLGLIVSELVMNAYQHAFPDREQGGVSVSLHEVEEGYRLTVEDDGRGLPEGISLDAAESLGLRLVSALSSQLRGTIAVDAAGGTRFILEFPTSNRYSS